MNCLKFLFFFITVAIKLACPGGVKKIAAENLLLRQQLITLSRHQKRSPILKQSDRLLFGILLSWINPRRLFKLAIVVRPSTLIKFHKALVARKYRLLFSNKSRKKPGPKGPSKELIDLIMVIMDQFTRRIIGFSVHVGNLDGLSLCRMFNRIIANKELPTYLSSDHDPLFNFHRWQANLRILDIKAIKTVPYVPMSHPFVERLIGTIRREYLDHVLFWNERDLQNKLDQFKEYFNKERVHTSLGCITPIENTRGAKNNNLIENNYRWKNHCGHLFQLPMAA